MLDLCGRRRITADIEAIRMQEIEGAFAHMLKSSVQCRFVIDRETMAAAA